MNGEIRHTHYQKILSILLQLNSQLLEQEGILFAGGARVPLEISELRLSNTLIFWCKNRNALSAIRDEVDHDGNLGRLGSFSKPLLKNPRFPLNSIQMYLKAVDTPIKLEFILMGVESMLKQLAVQLLGLKERLIERGVPEQVMTIPGMNFDYIEDKLKRWKLV